MTARVDDEVTRRTLWKLDLILLPFLSLLFLVNSLDRSNIGNAETASFTKDAGLQPDDLNDAVAWFFAFFVALQPLGAAAGRKFGMSLWVPSVMTLWGICTLFHVWVRKRWQLILLRIVIGTLEAGFYPTAVSYLSLFYTRYEFGRRLGLFYGAYGIAGALGGLIAYVVFSRFTTDDGTITSQSASDASWKPWQLLFMIEGCLTIVIALIGYLWLPRSADTAWFLNPEERICAATRVAADRDLSRSHDTLPPSDASAEPTDDSLERQDDQAQRLLEGEHSSGEGRVPDKKDDFTADRGLSNSDVLSTFLFLPVILPMLLLNIATAIPSTGFSIFLPIVLSSLKMASPLKSNLLTVPPFLLASIMLYIFMHWSDKSRKRFIPILTSLGVIAAGLGLTILLSRPSSSNGVVILYFCLCLLLSGCFIPSPLIVAWYAGNIPDPGKRAIVLGINGYGNLAGILAARIFAPKYQESGFRVPFIVTFGIILLGAIGFAGFRVMLEMINEARKKYLVRWSDPDAADEHISGLGRKQNWGERVPTLVLIGGGLWDRSTRYLVGMKLLGMDVKSAYTRRGNEKVGFQYGY